MKLYDSEQLVYLTRNEVYALVKELRNVTGNNVALDIETWAHGDDNADVAWFEETKVKCWVAKLGYSITDVSTVGELRDAVEQALLPEKVKDAKALLNGTGYTVVRER